MPDAYSLLPAFCVLLRRFRWTFAPCLPIIPPVMTYRETLDQIYGLARFGITPGLERISRLLSKMGDPQRHLKSVSISGTNGKGSTASFLSSILAAAGYRIGLFTSPHLVSFTERIRINGAEIPEADVVRLAVAVQAAAPPRTTFFEIVTAIALKYFSEQGVDLAVMETGMGGRFDSTNVTDPMLSIITPISMDHCEYLGDSLTAIAREKCGIIRPGRAVVSAGQEDSVLQILEQHAASSASPLYLAGREFTSSWRNSVLDYWGLHDSLTDLHPGIPGRHQSVNASCALCAAELLSESGFELQRDAFRSGISAAIWPGRMELFGHAPRIMLDGAHNPGGSRVLADSLGDIPRKRLLMVFGVMQDKDAAAILKPLLPLSSRVFAVSPSIDRAMPVESLTRIITEMGGDCIPGGSVVDGLAMALADSTPEDLILVCGSLFTVGEARGFLTGTSFEPVRG